MHQLFERWIEHLVKRWTHAFGGHLFSARKGQTIVPIPWARPTISSLTSLVPDIVVRRGTEVFVFDAKYKGHFDELDERRWAELSEELRADHRHDVHQVVAYSALFESTLTTTALVYPVPLDTWKRLSEQGRVISIAMIASGGRPIRLALVGVPLQLDPGQSADCIIETWGRAFESQVVN